MASTVTELVEFKRRKGAVTKGAIEGPVLGEVRLAAGVTTDTLAKALLRGEVTARLRLAGRKGEPDTEAGRTDG